MTIMARILRFIKRRSAGSESDYEYDGAFSYASENHAAIIGLGVGFTAAVVGQPVVLAAFIMAALGIEGVELGVTFKSQKVLRELRSEPWYFVGAGLVGYVASLGVV